MKLNSFELIDFNIKRIKHIERMLSYPRIGNLFLKMIGPSVKSKERFWNKSFRYGVVTLGWGTSSPDEMAAFRSGFIAIREVLERNLHASENFEPVVWVEWITHSELLAAFDVPYFCTELLNIFGNTKGTDYPPALIAEAERKGIPPESCSAVKLSVGSYLLKQIPEPSVIIAASHPCDSSVGIYQALEYLTKAPTFAFDMPYWKNDSGYAYYEDMTWELIQFLEKHLERKLNWQRLKQILDQVDQVNACLQEVCEMAQARPCPNSMINLLFAWVAREVAIGSPHVLDLAKGIRHAVYKRYQKNEGVVKQEKIRVLMWFPPIGFFTHIFRWMEERFGAVVVVDFIGHISTVPINTTSPETMIKDLAKSHMHIAMGRQCHGPLEYITDELVMLMESYEPDCMIFTGHNGCKHGWASIKQIKHLCKRKELPALFLNLDIMDKRHTSEAELKKQITDFFVQNGWA
jgi:benzoyl-CoA reductase/2-hydroxyglutaryl-CoA dehydratase subunit BcrC/BadD/HgdB